MVVVGGGAGKRGGGTWGGEGERMTLRNLRKGQCHINKEKEAKFEKEGKEWNWRDVS